MQQRQELRQLTKTVSIYESSMGSLIERFKSVGEEKEALLKEQQVRNEERNKRLLLENQQLLMQNARLEALLLQCTESIRQSLNQDDGESMIYQLLVENETLKQL